MAETPTPHEGPPYRAKGSTRSARRLAPIVITAVVLTSAIGCRGPRTPDAGASDASGPSSPSAPASQATAPTGSSVGSTGTRPAPAVAPAGTTVDGTLRTADGRDRTYRVYLPASLPGGAPVPLLVALHGGTGWGTQFEANSGFDGIAEANGFIVVYPDGIRLENPLMPNSRVWNGGSCCAIASREGVDDVGFVAALIDELASRYPVDADRVYAAGHSNGGIMSYRLACELADRIAAIGVQAGWMAIDSCRPSRPVPVLHLHGAADENARFDGGPGPRSISGAVARPALETVGMLAVGNGCGDAPSSQTAGELTTYTWPCSAGVDVELVKVAGAGHAWMGHAPHSRLAGLVVGTPSMVLDASAEIWAFVSAHTRS